MSVIHVPMRVESEAGSGYRVGGHGGGSSQVPGLSTVSGGVAAKERACYENPLFEEDGTVIGDTHTKLHGGVVGGQPGVGGGSHGGLVGNNKHYDLHQPAQTSVHYRQSSPKRKKRLYILGVLVAIAVIIGLVVGIIVGQRGDGGSSEKESSVLYRTTRVDGSIRISKGPFSTFKLDYMDPTSKLYSLFDSSFTYQMNSIFKHSAKYSSSFSETRIVNISSGSVVVEFSLLFRHAIDIAHQTPSVIATTIIEGLYGSVFGVQGEEALIIQPRVSHLNDIAHKTPSVIATTIIEGLYGSVFGVQGEEARIIQPRDPALSVITTPTPGVCLPLSSPSCVNVTDWSTTTFPNLLGHTTPTEVLEAESRHQDLLQVSCGKDFWCTVFNPRCHRARAMPPCRSYCKSVYTSCGKYYASDYMALLDCNTLPNTEDPNVCTPDPYKANTCHAHEAGGCLGFGYEEVMFPNFANHRNPYEAADLIQIWAGINFATKCYKHSLLFTCAALMPDCKRDPNGRPRRIPPCKSLCNDFKAGCEIFMNIFFFQWPEDLYCDSFPDVDDPNVCIGYREAHEPIKIDECAVDEARCDNTTCYPLRWKCDDHKDCADGSDETPIQTFMPLRRCAVCPDDMFRCTPKSTICLENSRRCDGFEDCPTGSDEQECVKLDDGGSSGLLRVYNPDVPAWEPVCADGAPSDFANTVCLQLGYISDASTGRTMVGSSSTFTHVPLQNDSNPHLAQSGLKRAGQCSSRQAISITCGHPICGIRPAYVPPAVRIVGGDLADPEAWPWQVSIHGGANLRYFCAGSIISDRWILTASHCIGGHTNIHDMLLRVGQPRRNTYSAYLQELHPAELIPYPWYNHSMVDNDLALIKTRETIKFNDHVRPICLPPTGERLPVGTRCTVVGWGKRNESALNYEREMKQVYLEVVDQDDCKAAIEGAPRQVPYRLNEHMFCAGGGLGHDACSGDSGGPLLCSLDHNYGEDRWFTGGVVSWGVGCAYPNVPGVYTNLPAYLDWIRNTTELDYLVNYL